MNWTTCVCRARLFEVVPAAGTGSTMRDQGYAFGAAGSVFLHLVHGLVPLPDLTARTGVPTYGVPARARRGDDPYRLPGPRDDLTLAVPRGRIVTYCPSCGRRTEHSV